MSREQYDWNIAYNFIMELKDDYVTKYGEKEIYNLKEMIAKVNQPKYNHFMNCTKTTQENQLYPNCVLIKYSLIGAEQPDLYENPNSMYREMRSIVIDIKNETIVCCPFRKFFNINEIPETEMPVIIDKMKNAKVMEISNKLDGSMQQARYYNGRIVYTGSSAMDIAKSDVLGEGLNVFNGNPNYEKLVKENPDFTWIFEYTAPTNLIVVKYDEEKLSLIGARNVYTGKQLSYNEMIVFANKYNLPHTEVETKKFDEVVNSTAKYKADEKEGWVLYIDGEQFKLKCDDYREVHKILSFVSSPKVIIKAIADDYFDDLLAKVPSAYKDNVMKVANIIYNYVHERTKLVEENYAKTPKDCDDKTFAIYVNKNVPKEVISYMFMKRKNRPYHFLKNHINTDQPSYIKMSDIIGTNDYIGYFHKLGVNLDKEDN